jgi:hypothetical protein
MLRIQLEKEVRVPAELEMTTPPDRNSGWSLLGVFVVCFCQGGAGIGT